MIKPAVDLFPWDSIPIGPDELQLWHIDLLITHWWTRSITRPLEIAIPAAWVLPVSTVLAHFASGKYPARDWETNPTRHTASQHFAAFKRHYHTTEELDAESGLPHWWLAVSRAVMLATLAARGVLIDDRPPMSAATAARRADLEVMAQQVSDGSGVVN